MKMRTRLLVLFLAFITLAAIFLSSCKTPTDTPQTTAPTTTETEEERTPPLAKANYGETFTVLYPQWGTYQNFFFVDETVSDNMSKAIYDRQILVEEHLGVTLKSVRIDGNTSIKDVAPRIVQNAMAGDDEYQMVLTHCFEGVVPMATGEHLYDLAELPNIDLDAPYWNKNVVEGLAMNGAYYYAINDFMISEPLAIFFNKTIATNNGIDNLYQIVKDGEWTIDKMSEIAQSAFIDAGEGEENTYGFSAMSNYHFMAFMSSSGIKVIEHDENGDFKLTLNNDRMITLTEKIQSLANAQFTNLYPYAPLLVNTDETFLDGKSLFAVVSTADAANYGNTDTPIGILPFPKLDTSQKEYYAQDWSGLFAIPAAITNPEMVGSVVEMLAYFSEETTMPAYYDRLLGSRYSNEPEDREMLELIFSSLVAEPALSFCTNSGTPLGNLVYTLVRILKDGSFASHYASYEQAAQLALDILR